MKDQTILIVDDEPDIVDVVKAYLDREGYATLEAYDGESALGLWREHRPDLVVLDILMPRLDGLSFCRTVREESRVPIIFISARTSEDERLEGLELGADDYMIKPFSPRELVARVGAVLRRHAIKGDAPHTLKAGPLLIDEGRYRVEVDGGEVALTPMEFKVLIRPGVPPGAGAVAGGAHRADPGRRIRGLRPQHRQPRQEHPEKTEAEDSGLEFH